MAEDVTPAPKEYGKLSKKIEYDVDAARELAEAMNERHKLVQRVEDLTEIIDENQKLKPFVWTTADGVSKAHEDLDTEHLQNIIIWQVEHNQTISKEVLAEAKKRGIAVPRQGKLREGSYVVGGMAPDALAYLLSQGRVGIAPKSRSNQ